MLDGSHNTKLNTLLSTRKSGKESTFVVVIERTTQSIAHFIGKCSNTGHPIRIHLHSQRVLRHLGSLSRPAFTINNDTRINRRSSLTDFIHRCNIMNPHQVKAESIKMVFVMSDKMDKTVTIQIKTRVRHPLYGKIMNQTSKLKVHDENNECGVGDTIRVMETRPLSHDKRWRLVEIIEKAK